MNTKLITTLSEENIKDLEEVARKYQDLDEETLFNYLWKMTYDPTYALEKSGLTVSVFLPVYKKTRNYIFEEYGKPEILDPLEEYDTELFKSLGQDKFAYCFICKKLDYAINYFSENELIRINKLLNSKIKSNQFGGLRSLKLTLSEAKFFEGFEKAIANITRVFEEKLNNALENVKKCSKNKFDEHMNSYEEKQDTKLSTNINRDKELINFFTKCIENKEKIFKSFELLDIISNNYEVRFEDMIEGYETFKNLFELLDSLKNSGVNLNYLKWLNDNINTIEEIMN